MGYIVKGNKGSDKISEQDCVACAHCQAVVIVEHYVKQGGWCWHCGATLCYLCAETAKTEGCVPFKKQIDELVDRMERDAAWRCAGLVVD